MDQGPGLGGFTVDDLIRCYERGVFPMADSRHDEDFYLIEPKLRGVIPLEGFHVPRRLARTVRADRYRFEIDQRFGEVLAGCAASGPSRPDTWISRQIEALYLELFMRGFAHSVEAYDARGALVGGLYGVAIGGAFFGESMFSTARDASKAALVHLVARLIVGGYRLLDTQFLTEHLTQFGAEEIDRIDYKRRLAAALPVDADFYVLGAGAVDGAGTGTGAAFAAGAGRAAGRGVGLGVAGIVALQAITQAS
jgi:leucyl/phenylalanyl-tRNA--protein transferase